MPAESWRTMPARSKSLCETTSASAGSSRRVGTKYCDQRIVFCQLNSWKSVNTHSRLARELTQRLKPQSPQRPRKERKVFLASFAMNFAFFAVLFGWLRGHNA